MKKSLLLLFTLMLFLFSSCGGENSAPPSDGQTQKMVTEPGGGEITIPVEINRIIVMAPSITEILIDLDCAGKIIAADERSAAYEALADHLPAFDMMTPDAEKIAELNPDIIFVSGMSTTHDDSLFKPLTDLGICIVALPTSNSIEEIKQDILFIGEVLDKQVESQALCDNMQTEIDRIAELGKSVPATKTVYFEIAAAPNMYSFGSGVFLNDMINLVGAENILADQEGWLSVEPESAVAANPDVILTSVDYLDDPVADILTRGGWQDITAVKNGDVYYIDSTAASLPNHNVINALNEMAKAVYPETYE